MDLYKAEHIVMHLSGYMGIGMVIGFAELLQIVNVKNYNAVANPHTVELIVARA